MGRQTAVRVSGGLLAIVTLLGATSASATPPLQCTSPDFVVNAVMNNSVVEKMTTYTYSLSSPTGAKANKLFLYVNKGLQGDLTGTVGGVPAGVYAPNGSFPASNCPPGNAWDFNKDNDGYCFTEVGMHNSWGLSVSERFQPEEGRTTILLGMAGPKGKTSYQACGPIVGPTTPAAPEFVGSPVETTTTRVVFANGCIYDLTAGLTDNLVKDVQLAPTSPSHASTTPPHNGEACEVTTLEGICELELGIVFCPPVPLNRPPIQGASGGTCYYPIGKKVTC